VSESEQLDEKLLSKLCVGDLSFGVPLSLAFRFIAAVSWSAAQPSKFKNSVTVVPEG